MKTQKELDLLVDLAKLLRKYGPETFKQLAESISSPETVQHLSNVLTKTAEATRRRPGTRAKAGLEKRIPVPRKLTNLEDQDPDKYKLLMELYRDLAAQTVLPSLRDIKDFVGDCGLPEIRARARQKAISPLISSLIALPYERVVSVIQSLRRHNTGDRSLEGWSEIILDSRGQSKDE